MKRILMIGPDIEKAKGGMATVEKQILYSKELGKNYKIDFFPSYADGNSLYRLFFSAKQFMKFTLCRMASKYDIVHFHMASNMSTYRKMAYGKLLKKAGKEYIIHFHAAEYLDFFSHQDGDNQKRIEEFFKEAKCVIALSQRWKKDLMSILDIENIKVVENCIDAEYFSKAISDTQRERTTFLYLGIVSERKGMWDVVKAVENLCKIRTDFLVLVAGNGEIERLKKLIHEKDISKYFQILGWVDMEGKLEALKKSQVLLLPSYNEGLPMSILEAMAAGKIIISSTVGAIPEVIKSENGFLITPGDVKGLTECMLKSFNSNLYEQISENNVLKIREQFDISTLERKIGQVYEL